MEKIIDKYSVQRGAPQGIYTNVENRQCVIHYGFLSISNGFGWMSCTWIPTYLFIIYKAFTEDKSLGLK